jgi:tetratricopeptide (TPR) repeat protein
MGGVGRSLSALLGLLFFGAFSIPALSQQIVYDKFVKVTIPAGWSERRVWEMGEDRSLPLYNRQLEAAAFVFGMDHPLYPAGYIESLVKSRRLAHRLEVELNQWPAEATRYYAMITNGTTMRSTPQSVTVGPSFRPAEIQYLGTIKLHGARIELAQYTSSEEITPAFAEQYQMSAEFVHTRLQVLFGQATFEKSAGYAFLACRFTTAPDLQWIEPLLNSTVAVPSAEKSFAVQAERQRDLVSHAAAVAESPRYYHHALEAAAVIEPALAANPKDDNVLSLKAELLLEENNLNAAEETLRSALQNNPENERAHVVLAEVLAAKGNNTEAVAELAAARRLSPLYPDLDQIQARLRSRRMESSVAPPRP